MTRPFASQAVVSVMVPRLGRFNRWYIGNIDIPYVAWTGSRWDLHNDGLPTGPFQICNFNSEYDAQKYINALVPALSADDSASAQHLLPGGTA